MRGAVTRLNKKLGCGFILGEDGCEAYFDLFSLEGMDTRALSIGKAVEHQEHFGHERLRARQCQGLTEFPKRIRQCELKFPSAIA
jgi:cold shock CspA family protein